MVKINIKSKERNKEFKHFPNSSYFLLVHIVSSIIDFDSSGDLKELAAITFDFLCSAAFAFFEILL